MLLAIGVLLSGLSGVAVANEQGMLSHDPSAYSPSADPSWPPAQSDAGQIREPMETGAVPDGAGRSSDLDSSLSGQEPTVEFGGVTYRAGIDIGP